MAVIQVTSADFQQKILDQKGLVFVDFYADWCGPCKVTSPLIEELSEETKYKDIHFLKLDVDDNQELSGRYSVFSIPTFIIFKDGKPVNQFVGARDKGGFQRELDKTLQ